LRFMLRPSSHLRSHDIPQTSRRARSRRRGIPQRAHPNIPLTTTHATTLLSAKSRYRRVGRALCATLLPPIAVAFRCPIAGLIGVDAEAESSILTRLAHAVDRPADELALHCQAASDFQGEALVRVAGDRMGGCSTPPVPLDPRVKLLCQAACEHDNKDGANPAMAGRRCKSMSWRRARRRVDSYCFTTVLTERGS